MVTELECPECQSPMLLRAATGQFRAFYACTRYPTCRGTHGAHPDGRPLGKPATIAVKRLRQAAHATFDPLWQPGPQQVFASRGNAYTWMQRVLGMSEEDAHIANFDAGQCKRLVNAVWMLDEGDVEITGRG